MAGDVPNDLPKTYIFFSVILLILLSIKSYIIKVFSKQISDECGTSYIEYPGYSGTNIFILYFFDKSLVI